MCSWISLRVWVWVLLVFKVFLLPSQCVLLIATLVIHWFCLFFYDLWTACRNHLFFIPSSAHGHVGYFHILALVNSTAVNIGMLSLWVLDFNACGSMCVSAHLDCFLDHRVVLALIFRKPPCCFLQSHQYCTRIPIVPGPCHSLSLFSFYNIQMWYPIVVLIAVFLMIRCWPSFPYTCWPFACLLWRNRYASLPRIFWLGY